MKDVSLFSTGRYLKTQQQIKRYTGLFGALFTGMQTIIGDKVVDVPIIYAGGEAKFRIKKDIESKKTLFKLPAMAFEFVSMNKDMTRKVQDYAMNTVNYTKMNEDGVYVHPMKTTATPYNLIYRLYVRTSTMEDSLQMFERIQAAFAQTVNVMIVDDVESQAEKAINISIASDPEFTNTDDVQIDQQRYVELVVDFMLKGFLYSTGADTPIVTSASVLDQFIECDAQELQELLNKGAIQ